MTTTSTAQVQAQLVLEACDRYLEARREFVEGKIEQLVRKEMYKRWNPATTREEALRRLKTEIEDIKFTGGYWPALVKSLRSLALLATKQAGIGYMTLTRNDADLLKGYWE